MDNNTIISTMNEYMHDLTNYTCKWLEVMLPAVCDDWWDTCVLDNVSEMQKTMIEQDGITSLSQLDLAALLRVAYRSWWNLTHVYYLANQDKYKFHNMMHVRNRWAHIPSDMPDKSVILSDLEHIKELAIYTGADYAYQNKIRKFAECIETDTELVTVAPVKVEPLKPSVGEIGMYAKVHLVSDPDAVGIVLGIEPIGDNVKYTVWLVDHPVTLYKGQIALNEAPSEEVELTDRKKLLSNITAYQIKNPSQGKLYSLNAAKIDFVPYQFRPALKLIKSEHPRLLIADSVGVGKTIEAGIILKEMEARSQMDKVIIICPKPLITERKWELEMKRFDEEFVPIDGKLLRQILSDYDKDGEWPQKYNKCIIPYSLLTEELLVGNAVGKKKSNIACLAELDPLPHFDMVIVDEAHHIRNSNTNAYKCVEYFCDNAEAAIFLTATPIQMGNEDLFTLLHLLRSDLIADNEVFRKMSEPNKYINDAARTIRTAGNDWQHEALNYLTDMQVTDWGQKVIAKDPAYSKVVARLQEPGIESEERVDLITSVESLNSFSSIINRTRRKDIQDFCVRGTDTVEVDFTFEQKQLYDCLIDFEEEALTMLHGSMCIKFMMTTLMRQAASCIFGLDGSIRDITNRRLFQMSDDFVDGEYTDANYTEGDIVIIKKLAQNLLDMTRSLSKDKDPKFDALLEVVEKKQKLENNKIIIFSCFRHTLKYLSEKLAKAGYRVGHIDGSVPDDERYALRSRFEKPYYDRDAIDIMLFTEVGSEGLDYQFCDMIINYDLPWNPMRIEQRIGRIDRRGQKSEKVNIINIITKGTIDADIYNRCLKRIGIFESNIGDCDSILGSISNDIQKIINNTELTEEERAYKLEKLTENSVRQMNELRDLEEQEKRFVGFDLGGMIMNNEMQKADDVFISPAMLQFMIEQYLNEVAGDGRYISGDGAQKNLRLSEKNRLSLKDDFNKLSKNSHGAVETVWRNYLKSADANVAITFDPEYASDNPKCIFITPTHPLTRQAAAHFKMPETLNTSLIYYSDEYEAGVYPFAIYSWSYSGYRPENKLVAVCKDEVIEEHLFEIMSLADSVNCKMDKYKTELEELDHKNMIKWQEARNQHVEDVALAILYKQESLKHGYETIRARILSQLESNDNPKIVSMKKRQLEKEEDVYNSKLEAITAEGNKVDIITSCIVKGVLEIRRG